MTGNTKLLALILVIVCVGLVAGKCTKETAPTGNGTQIEIPAPPPADRNTQISNTEKGYWTPRH